MKVGLITLINRIILQNEHVKEAEYIWLLNYLRDVEGKDPYVISKKIKKEKKLDYYLDAANTDLNQFEEIYIYNQAFNAFGGVVLPLTFEIIKALGKYNGKVFFVCTDPLLWATTYADTFKRRIREGRWTVKDPETMTITDDEIAAFAKTMERMECCFAGRNYDEFIQKFDPKVKLPFGKHIPLFEYMFANYNKIDDLNLNTEREFDAIYFGYNRGMYRRKKIEHFMNNDNISKYFIGYNPEFKNQTWLDQVDHRDLYNEIKRAYASVIIGDKSQENIFIAPRLFDTVKCGTMALIDVAYDRDKLIFGGNKLLEEHCYVTNKQDVEDVIKKVKADKELYKKILREQKSTLEKFERFIK